MVSLYLKEQLSLGATSPVSSNALTEQQKRALLTKVVQSPQFHQSLASLTVALREGGLSSISEALGISIPISSAQLVGGDAVEAFVDGVKSKAKAKIDRQGDSMQTD
jgi:26S proteasome regulatory subunit N13